jgi:hypothetical protein
MPDGHRAIFLIQKFDGEIPFIPNADTFPFLEKCMLKPCPRFVSFFIMDTLEGP